MMTRRNTRLNPHHDYNNPAPIQLVTPEPLFENRLPGGALSSCQAVDIPSESNLPTPPLSNDETQDSTTQPEASPCAAAESANRRRSVKRKRLSEDESAETGDMYKYPSATQTAHLPECPLSEGQTKTHKRRVNADETTAPLSTPSRKPAVGTRSVRWSILSFAVDGQDDEDELALDFQTLSCSGRILPSFSSTPTSLDRQQPTVYRRSIGSRIAALARQDIMEEKARAMSAALAGETTTKICGRDDYVCQSQWCFRCGL